MKQILVLSSAAAAAAKPRTAADVARASISFFMSTSVGWSNFVVFCSSPIGHERLAERCRRIDQRRPPIVRYENEYDNCRHIGKSREELRGDADAECLG